MNRQEYIEQMRDDIIEYVKDNDIDITASDGSVNRDAIDELYDDFFMEDSVTGNGSGSYTFSSAKAHENIIGAEDVIRELCEEWDIDKGDLVGHFLNEDWEWFDVSIRCFLLSEALEEAYQWFVKDRETAIVLDFGEKEYYGYEGEEEGN